ncbi:MFS transporter [Streptomyces sp. NPDC006516]|uniref:MFS transporter n=1 Tax=Streptomyces sp. NPDC006516 TaxID=3154309 RepID=UPI0033A03A48
MTSTGTRVLASLRTRNFRLFASGQLVSVAGTWMMVVAQDWLVLEMTGDSGTALGVVTVLQFTPVLLFTLYGGRLADRYDKRTLLMLANGASGVLALVLASLVLTEVVELWYVYCFAFALGLVNAVEVPARMSFVSELVGPALLPNASALSAAYFNVARVAGPALAGLLISQWGAGWVMLANGLSYVATVVALRLMRPAELHRARRTDRSGVGDGLRYLAGRRDLVVTLSLVAVVAVFGMNFQLTLPLLARTVFHADATTFGLVTAAFAVGSLLAALSGTLRRRRPSARLVVTSAALFGVSEAAVGWAPTLPSVVFLLFVTGFTTTYFAQAANHRVQLGSDPGFRGRVMALYTLILQGSAPLGALLIAWISEQSGVRTGFVVGGLVSLAAAGAAIPGERFGRRLAGGGLAAEEEAAGTAPEGKLPVARHDRPPSSSSEHTPRDGVSS